MLIANPIYDVVFKYMMNDNKVAKLMLSAIIGEEIEELDFKPKELAIPLKEAISVLRMDFKAKVRYQDGSQQLITIEIQKARLSSDIMRFRNYLGEQYQDPENTIITETVEMPDGIVERRTALPILSIYFLGHRLKNLPDIPVVKVGRDYIDVATNEVLKVKETFIECLTHDSFVIQIPYVKGRRRTDLEQLLHIFDQTLAQANKQNHLLNINEEEIPKRYRPVLRRLLQAFATAEVRDQMQAEDEYLEDMRFQDMKIKQQAKELQQKAEELEQKDQQLGQKDEELQQKDQQLEQKDEELQQKDQQLEQKDEELEQKEQQIKMAILRLLDMGADVEDIATMLHIKQEMIKRIQQQNRN